MANQLGVAMINSIISLKERGYSNREIAQLLGIYRGTVNNYVNRYKEGQNQPNLPTGNPGSRSICSDYHDHIVNQLELGLHAQRIFQDLFYEHGFSGSYDSVKRYVRKLRYHEKLPCRRMETLPGKEAQVDFGQGAPIRSSGKTRRPWLFRIMLSNSHARQLNLNMP